MVEFASILYLASINNTIDVIIRFIALGSISKIDDFYASAVPSENKVKASSEKITVTNRRRNINKSSVPCLLRFYRYVYKVFRLFYASYFFYFFPFTALFVPYVANATHK